MQGVDHFIENDDEIQDAQYDEEEEVEEVIPKRRRVVGIVRRNQIQQNRPPLPREISNQQVEYIPEPYPAQQPMFIPQQNSFQYQKSLEQQAHDQARLQMLYNEEMRKQEMREMRRQMMAQRPSTSKKLLAVANKYAKGDNGAQRVNAGIGGAYFVKPNVELPTSHPIKKNVALKFNNVISRVAPKVAPLKTSVNFKSKKKGKK